MNEVKNRVTRELRAALAIVPPASWTVEDITIVRDAVNQIARKRSATEGSYANVVPIGRNRKAPACV